MKSPTLRCWIDSKASSTRSPIFRSERKAVLRPTGVFFLAQPAQFSRSLHGDANGAAEEGIEGVDPEHLCLEHDAEVAGDGFGNGVQIEFAAELLLHRSHGLRRNAAGDDQIEVAEVG